MKKTRKNKSYALILLCAGVLSVFIDGDVTVFILSLMMGIPLFLARKNVII